MGDGDGSASNGTHVPGPGVVAGAAGLHPHPAAAAAAAPPPPAVAAANGGGGGGGPVDKVKFTVSVRGHQWSSARHVNETLEEFAAAIQRNARRLEFIDDDDGIQRLQLTYSDGSEPEDLDVDATLGDVIICMGDKQLVAIVNSSKLATNPPCKGNTAAAALEARSQASPRGNANAIAGAQPKCKIKTNSPDTAAAAAAPAIVAPDLASRDTAHKNFLFPHFKPSTRSSSTPQPRHSPASTDPSRSLKINIPGITNSIPPLDARDQQPPFHDVVNGNRSCSFHADHVCERLPSCNLPPLCPSRSNGKDAAMCGVKGVTGPSQPSLGHQFWTNPIPNAAPTPTPAELANMLVRSSSHPHRMGGNVNSNLGGSLGQPGAPLPNTRSSPSPATGGFQSFASALLSRLPMLPHQQNLQCPQGATTNIALLAQFLASQLRAFVPTEGALGMHPNAQPSPCREYKAPKDSQAAAVAAPNATNSLPAEKESHGGGTVDADRCFQRPYENHHGSPRNVDAGNHNMNNNNVNVKVSGGSGSQEKDESSSSANVNTTTTTGVAPSSGDAGGVDSEHPNGSSELVFLVNRRSKTGVGTHHLKMSDLSTYFHLSVVDAAKKLGVSQTTLKKACRKFGLKRWPGRKVRSLESTIHGLEHTIAVGQGAGLEELTEAYMRSEVSKLQQEMDQLVHGTPAQHSPAVRTADLYKRLYSRGWRSKYHSTGRHDVDLSNHDNNTTGNNNNNRTSRLKPTDASTKTVKSATPNQQQQQQQNQQSQAAKTTTTAKQQQQQVLVFCKDEPGQQQSVKESSRPASRDATGVKDMDIEGLLREPANKDHANNNNNNNNISNTNSCNNINQNSNVEGGGNNVVVVPEDNGAGIHTKSNTVEVIGEPDNANANAKEVNNNSNGNGFAERSPKRPKRECRIAAEGAAVRQGLRSSTCAM